MAPPPNRTVHFLATPPMRRILGILFFAVGLVPMALAEPNPGGRVRLGRLSVVRSVQRKGPDPDRPLVRSMPPIRFREIGWRVAATHGQAFPASDGTVPPANREPTAGSAASWNRTFISALGRRLLQKGASVHAVRDASRAREQGCPEMVSEFTWYDGDFREVSEARRDLVVDLVSGAAADTLEKTALGRWVRSLEALVERYSSVAYRRSSLAESGRFFLPGQAVPETPAAADAVAVTATTRLHLDSDDLAPEPELAVVAEYFQYQWHISLNPTQSEGSLFLSSKALDQILGVRVGMGISYDPKAEETAAGVVTLSGNF
jgi:hypothetical protein